MPRVTRAALRSQASPNDSEIAATVPLPATPPVTKRAPLGEIIGYQDQVRTPAGDSEELPKANKGPKKGKKVKSSKNPPKQNQQTDNGMSQKVVKDDNESEPSSAVEEACQDLARDDSPGKLQTVIIDRQATSPQSPAVDLVTEQLSPKPAALDTFTSLRAQEIVPALHARMDSPVELPKDTEPFPNLIQDSEMPSQSHVESGVTEDNTLIIKTTTPIKACLRPEDSIEAIDNFEEEIEKIGESIPAMHKGTKSQMKAKKGNKLSSSRRSAIDQKRNDPVDRANLSKSRRTLSTTGPKINTVKQRKMVVGPAAMEKAEAAEAQRQPNESSACSASELSSKAPVPPKKRVSSVHKPPFIPVKSTKPVTRPSFELPGEAVARRLKEAREERTKREEEEKPKKGIFKARPVRLSQAPVVKPTSTSRLRISLAKGEPVGTPGGKETSAKSTSRASISNATIASKRLSVTKRTMPVPANISARLSRGPSANHTKDGTNTVRKSPNTATTRASIPKADGAPARPNGKEVFNRGRIEHEELERMRKEKEEAAKKARMQASERGRIASREWAEKQRMKKLREKKGSETKKVVEASA